MPATKSWQSAISPQLTQRRPTRWIRHVSVSVASMFVALCVGPIYAGAEERVVSLRGHDIALQVFGLPSGRAVLLASGDGGFIHLAPRTATALAAQGFRVYGLDSRHYLSQLTTSAGALSLDDVRHDWLTLLNAIGASAGPKPILAGVSEGAGLSVLAASDPDVAAKIAGVVTLGLPVQNELGWRFRDSIIYITKGVPNEPLFSTLDIVPKLANVRLGLLYATGDEFVPPSEQARITTTIVGPKKIVLVDARDHALTGHDAELSTALRDLTAFVIDAPPQFPGAPSSVASPTPIRN